MSPTAPAEEDVQYEGARVGSIIHFYDKISVAVVHAEKAISAGDVIKIYDKSGDVVVEQTIESMEIDGETQKTVDKDTDFGLKVEGEVKEGYLVYRQ